MRVRVSGPHWIVAGYRSMLTYDDALETMLAAATALGHEEVPTGEAAGRYLAQDISAQIDSPRADVSAMDGYAVRMDAARDSLWFEVVGESAAGQPYPEAIAPGQAVRIFTGAHVPRGADCVVMQEYAEREDGRVRFREGFGPARHIRKRGSDFEKGATLLSAGQRLTPGAVVTLAGADVGSVCVGKRPRVAIIATGDELDQPGEAHNSEHSVPESGSYGVAAMAREAGAMIVQQIRGRDDLQTLQHLAIRALEVADCVVVIGGASVGDHDLARPMFEGTDLHEHFAKVAIKPGKPVWFGTAGDKAVLGLPGNPTSALVTARLFLRPLLAALQGGIGAQEVRFLPQIVAAALPANGTRETFTRACSSERGLVPATNQESGAQAPLVTSDWLIRRAPDTGPLEAGERVSAVLF